MKTAFMPFKRLTNFTVAAILLLTACSTAWGQQEFLASAERLPPAVVEPSEAGEPGCFSPKLAVITDRPTASSSSETTQCGVLEVLSGPERIWQGHGAHQDDIAPSLQFGLTPNLDLHYARATYFRLGGGSNPLLSPLFGTGDTFVGARYKLNKQRRILPSFGAFYTLKLPTGSPSEGFGTGRYDHFLALIASKDLPRGAHVDFNVVPALTGRIGESGFDKNTEMILFNYAPAWHRMTVGAGAYGFTRLNDATPPWAAAGVAVNWQVSSRLILDAGFDEGLTAGAPRKRISFGFTCAPANLYALIAGPRERTH